MAHGILQFTPSIAFRYVLHRCKSRDIRCRESFWIFDERGRKTPRAPRPVRGGRTLLHLTVLGADRAGVCCFATVGETNVSATPAGCAAAEVGSPTIRPRGCNRSRVRGPSCGAGFDNDPSAGSPTETLLRLLLPLNDKVQWTSRDVAGRKPPASPRSEHFTGPFNR